MHTLQSYLQIDADSAPDVLFARGEQAASAAIEKLAARPADGRVGWLRRRSVRGAARRIRVLMGARESPKFFAIRVMGIARRPCWKRAGNLPKPGRSSAPETCAF